MKAFVLLLALLLGSSGAWAQQGLNADKLGNTLAKAASAQALLSQRFAGGASGTVGTPLTSVTGLAGWWDASSWADASSGTVKQNMRTIGGAALFYPNNPVTGVIDKGSGGHLMTVGGDSPIYRPKLVASSGGIGDPTNYARYQTLYWPAMAEDISLSVTPGQDFGSATDWTIMLVWSRPQIRQTRTGQTIDGTGLTGNVTLLTIGSVPVLTMGGAGAGADVLHLFPTGANTALISTLARHHTHTLLLVNDHTVGVKAVLDGVTVATAVSAAAMGSTNIGTMLFMDEPGTANGSAQLWFHEAAYWTRALGSTDLTNVDAVLTGRYPAPLRGARKGLILVLDGQRNAQNLVNAGYADADPIIASGISYQMGIIAVSLMSTDRAQNFTSHEVAGGLGMADPTDTQGFLSNNYGTCNVVGCDPSVFPAGASDTAIQTDINARSASDKAEIAGIIWYWSENDSANWLYSEEYPTLHKYSAVVLRQLALERGYITAVQSSASAVNTPVLMVAVPYGDPHNGAPMVRQAYSDVAIAGPNNFSTYEQTFDTVGSLDTCCTSTGQWTMAGDLGQRSVGDHIKLAKRLTFAMSQRLMAAGRCEWYCSMGIGAMLGQGPRITNAARDTINPAIVHLAIAQDGGTDITVGPTASLCHGFNVTQGTPPANTELLCNKWTTGGGNGSAVRVDATHVDVTFPSTVAGFSALEYPHPGIESTAYPGIGRNNAITDNYSAVAPVNWNPAEIGWTGMDFPIQMPTAPSTLGHILTVGPGKTYATISAAIAASVDGDIIQVQAGTYTNDSATISTSITLQAVGGRVVMNETVALANDKGILIAGTAATTPTIRIDGFEFSGATGASANAAGVLYQSGNLVLTNDYFHDNQDGMRGSPINPGEVLVDHCEFNHNGTGDGFTHNVYMGIIPTFTVQNSYTHDAVSGHEIKSRALNTNIWNNRIFDNLGTASYSIDIPQSGNTIIAGNIIQQGVNTQNPGIIAYGEETGVGQNAGLNFQIFDNVIVNDLTTSPVGVNNSLGTGTATLMNNFIFGLTSGQVASGTNTQAGDIFITVRPTLDTTTHPFH